VSGFGWGVVRRGREYTNRTRPGSTKNMKEKLKALPNGKGGKELMLGEEKLKHKGPQTETKPTNSGKGRRKTESQERKDS